VNKIKESWLFLKPYLKQHKLPLVGGIGLVLVGTALEQIPPWMVRNLLDGMQSGSKMDQLLPYLVFMGLAILVSELLLYFQRLWVIQASRKIEYQLRNDFFVALLQQPRAFFDQHTLGDLMSRMTNDLDRIRDFLGPVILHLFRMVSMIVFSLVAVFLIHPLLGFVGLIPVLVVPFFVNRFLKKMYSLHANIQKDLGELNSFVQDAVSGIEVMRVYGAQDSFLEKFKNSSARLCKDSIQISYFTAAMWPFIGLLGSLGILMAIWTGSQGALRGQFTVGSLSAVLIYLLRLQFPLAGLGWVSNLFQRSQAAMERIFALKARFVTPMQAYNPELQYDYSSPPPQKFTQGLKVHNLSFTYSNKTLPVLNNISFELKPGQSLGIVGPTGCGKTTLLHVLCGIYAPPQETVFLDAVAYENTLTEQWRAQFSLAPQDGFLFSESIAYNILLGDKAQEFPLPPTSSPAIETKLQWAGQVSGFSKDLHQIEKGYDALLGERGINLSGGQRQRVGLARALLSPAPLLCLDDTLSALDAATEKEVLEQIKTHLQNKTLIISSHKYSAIAHCHLILYMEKGAVKEAGTHQQLMKLNGAYARVYNQQVISSQLETA